jgi:hypothetical protein
MVRSIRAQYELEAFREFALKGPNNKAQGNALGP